MRKTFILWISKNHILLLQSCAKDWHKDFHQPSPQKQKCWKINWFLKQSVCMSLGDILFLIHNSSKAGCEQISLTSWSYVHTFSSEWAKSSSLITTDGKIVPKLLSLCWIITVTYRKKHSATKIQDIYMLNLWQFLPWSGCYNFSYTIAHKWTLALNGY